MKKAIKLLAIIAAIIIGYFLILHFYPKNAGRYPFLIVLFAGDYYLWASFRSWLKGKKQFIKYTTALLYWLPYLLLVLTTGIMFYYPSDEWNQQLRIYTFGFIFVAFAAKFLPIIFLLLADVFRVFQFVNRKTISLAKRETKSLKGSRITRSEFLKKAGLISGGVMFSGLFVGMLKWAFDFKIHRHSLQIFGLPASFDGLKIVQISDIHLGSWASKTSLMEAISKINELNPDFIFFTGDLVNDKTDEAFPFQNILSRLKASMGIFATLGNHDYGDYVRWPSAEAKKQNMTDLFNLYKEMGWQLLNNENRVYENEDGKVAVLGVENWGDFGRFPKYGDLQKAMNGAEDAEVKLLLSHDPSHWEKVVTKDYQDIDLTFSGHTHGFQFGIEIKNIKWSPAQYAYKYWAGMYEKIYSSAKPQRLYVNRGLGTIGYPGRVGILPEITLFELYRA